MINRFFYSSCCLLFVLLTNGCQYETGSKMNSVKAKLQFERPLEMIFANTKAEIDSNFIRNSTVILIEVNKSDEVGVVILDKQELKYVVPTLEEPLFGYLEFDDLPIFVYGSVSDHLFSKTDGGIKYFDYIVAAEQITGEPPMIFEPIKKTYSLANDTAILVKEEYY